MGTHGWGTGWLFLAAAVGSWALGTRVTGAGRDLIGAALLLGALVSAAMAWAQGIFGLPVGSLDAPGERSVGLQGNAVHVGTLVAAALWLSASRLRTARRAVFLLAAAAVLAGATQFSGARGALVVSTQAGLRRADTLGAAVKGVR